MNSDLADTGKRIPDTGERARASRNFSLAEIESLESRLIGLPQIDAPLMHHFSDGVYLREVCMPAGSFIIGHEHKTRHLNIVLTGRATVLMHGEIREIVAPCTFESEPGVRKILYVHEECRWQTIHVTPERDLDKLRAELIVESETFKDHAEAERLRRHLSHTGKRIPETGEISPDTTHD